MFKFVISVKAPKLKTILPYRLAESMTKDVKEKRLLDIDYNFKELERWVNVKRNYTS